MSSHNGTIIPGQAASAAEQAASLAEQSAAALDAYSRTVIAVAEALSASVANLQVRRRTRRGPAMGAGSGVAISADGFLITSAHVVEGSRRGVASFSDGSETAVSLPSLKLATPRRDPSTTCAEVIRKPSAEIATPLPAPMAGPRRVRRRTWRLATLALSASATAITVREYASSAAADCSAREAACSAAEAACPGMMVPL